MEKIEIKEQKIKDIGKVENDLEIINHQITIKLSKKTHSFFKVRAMTKNKKIEQEIADFLEKETKYLKELSFDEAIK